MSYDLHFVRVPPGADPRATIEQALEQDEELDDLDVNPGDPDPAKEARKQAIARALMAADPELTIFPKDYAEIARVLEISESEARVRHRELELNGPEDGPGIQISLYDDTAAITLPYWHDGEAAGQVWRKIFTYLQVLEREGGFRTYDPQLDEVLDLSAGPDALLAQYGAGVQYTRQIAASHGAAPTKPWWKFW
jgi:hypothetical protein